jgi:hypothetical protein
MMFTFLGIRSQMVFLDAIIGIPPCQYCGCGCVSCCLEGAAAQLQAASHLHFRIAFMRIINRNSATELATSSAREASALPYWNAYYSELAPCIDMSRTMKGGLPEAERSEK